MKKFSDLTEQEVLALAITTEEEDSRIYRRGFAEAAARAVPLLRQGVRRDGGGRGAPPHHAVRPLPAEIRRLPAADPPPGRQRFHPAQGVAALADAAARLDAARKHAESMEFQAQRFYRKAAETARDVSVRKLLIELADAEAGHESLAHKLSEQILTKGAREKEDATSKRVFMLQYVQPGLAGLMDGSVSTLAPLFAAAFATHDTWATFLVGMAASVGAGISMGFAEALSDDGSLTGRGSPVIRGIVTGGMTAIGGLGHCTPPYLIPDFDIAMAVSFFVVAIELAVISYIRHHYMDTRRCCGRRSRWSVGGVLVFVDRRVLIGKFVDPAFTAVSDGPSPSPTHPLRPASGAAARAALEPTDQVQATRPAISVSWRRSPPVHPRPCWLAKMVSDLRASAGPHRRHRRYRQYRATTRVHARPRLAAKPGRACGRKLRARQP